MQCEHCFRLKNDGHLVRGFIPCERAKFLTAGAVEPWIASALRDSDPVVIIDNVPHAPEYLVAGITSHPVQRVSNKVRAGLSPEPFAASGQVAQVVERSPEKAGVGGSTPSLATFFQSLT